MTKPSIIPGEEDLGPQHVCGACGEAWPADHEFWKTPDKGGRCRACESEDAKPKDKDALLSRARERNRAYYARHREFVKMRNRQKYRRRAFRGGLA